MFLACLGGCLPWGSFAKLAFRGCLGVCALLALSWGSLAWVLCELQDFSFVRVLQNCLGCLGHQMPSPELAGLAGLPGTLEHCLGTQFGNTVWEHSLAT